MESNGRSSDAGYATSAPVLVVVVLVVLTVAIPPLVVADDTCGQATPELPVTPVAFVEGTFDRSEGITFNAEGRLFVAANQAVWTVSTDGGAVRLAELFTNLGMAPLGERDVLVADFGPTNAFQDGPNDDGIVWRVTPEGDKRVVATGIGDPNFILVRPDGSFLVSDDATDEIFLVEESGKVSLFSDAIDHPNGLAFSLDGRSLFVAQIFKSLGPVVSDDRIWRLPLDEQGRPAGQPVVIARTNDGGAPDGLAMDCLGGLYVAANGEGRIYRFDTQTGDRELIAENLTAVASLAFGRGEYDHHAIYASSTRRGGGIIWKVDVGVTGAPLHH